MLKFQLTSPLTSRGLTYRLLQVPPKRLSFGTQRIFQRYTGTNTASEPTDSLKDVADTRDQKQTGQLAPSTANATPENPAFVPWYLRMTQREAQEQQKPIVSNVQPLSFPKGSPQSLIKIAEFLRDKEGLTDILIFDVRGSDESTMAKMADFVIILTARSRKHAESVFGSLNRFIKRDFSSVIYTEGNIDMNYERKLQRRLRRKVSLGTSRGNIRSSKDKGISPLNECWLMIDTHVDGIFVNVLTEGRRYELNLEELYAPQEEKEKYSRPSRDEGLTGKSTDNLTDIPGENDILSGLRRLANQRRHYSTERMVDNTTFGDTYTSNLVRKLAQQDFASIHSMMNSEELQSQQQSPLDNTKRITILESIVDTLGSMSQSEAENIDVDGWKGIFDLHWPLYLPEGSVAYWRVRMRFLRLLNVAQPAIYHSRRLIKDYFILKQAFGEQLTKQDLIDLLELVKINIGNYSAESSDSDKLRLSVSNRVISDVIQQYIGTNLEDTILYDNDILYLLLECLISKPKAALETLYETVEFIGINWAPHLTPDTISIILSVPTDAGEWYKLLKFWETILPNSQHRADPHLWVHFLQAVRASNDRKFIEKIVIDGSLVWMHRYGVEITEELHKHLEDLYLGVFPTEEAASQLRLFLSGRN